MFLEILGALLFTLQEIDSDEFERNVLLFEYHRDGTGASGDIHSIKFQDHCVGELACGEGTWWFGIYTAGYGKLELSLKSYHHEVAYSGCHRRCRYAHSPSATSSAFLNQWETRNLSYPSSPCLDPTRHPRPLCSFPRKAPRRYINPQGYRRHQR